MIKPWCAPHGRRQHTLAAFLFSGNLSGFESYSKEVHHERDIAGALGLHCAAVIQYIRPEIIGFVLGSLIAALALFWGWWCVSQSAILGVKSET